MKQLIIILLMICASANAQTILIVNNSTPDKPTSDVNVKYKEFITVQFNNVNTLLLSGSLKATPLDIKFDDMPSILTTLSTIPKTESPASPSKKNSENSLLSHKKGKLSKQKAAQAALEKAAKEAEAQEIAAAIVQKKNAFITSLQSYIKSYDKIQNYIMLEDKLLSKLNVEVIIRDTKVLKENCKSDYNYSYSDSNKEKAKREIDNQIDNIRTQFAIMKQLYEDLNQTNEDETLNLKIVTSDNQTVSGIKAITVTKAKKVIFGDEMEMIKKQMTVFNSTEDQNKLKLKAHAGIDLYFTIKDCTFSMISADGPVQMLSDQLTITPTLKNKKDEVVKTFNPITFYVKSRWKVDFSTGYFLSFIGNDNYTKFKDAITGNEIGIKKADKDVATHAIGGMAHFYKKTANGPDFGYSFGASITEDTNIGFYGGLSLMFLESNRAIITIGCSVVKVKRLNEANLSNSSGDLLFRSNTDTEIVYDQVYRPALFVGFTYNLSKK